MSYNAWVAINKAMKATINQNPLALQIRAHTDLNIFKFFKEQDANGKTWQLFSIYADDVQSGKEIEDLATIYAGDFVILAGWKFEDGLQVGTSRDENGIIIGAPRYPLSTVKAGRTVAQWLLSFMPDVDGAPAIALADVHIMFGQAARDFTVY